MRAIGLDVHRDFCEVAVAEAGDVRSAGRIAARREVLEVFAQNLASEDRVVLEVTGNAWIIEPHVACVVVVSPSDTGIRQARAKTDRLDARTLAKLLAAGSFGQRLDAPRAHSGDASPAVAALAIGRGPHAH